MFTLSCCTSVTTSCLVVCSGYGYQISDQRLVADFEDIGGGGAWSPNDVGIMHPNYDGYEGTYDEEELRRGYPM